MSVGYEVRVFDVDTNYADRFENFKPLPKVEPLKDVVELSDVLLVCVPTPPQFYETETDICGPANIDIVMDVLRDICANLFIDEALKVVCIKSTTPPEFVSEMQVRFPNLHLHFSPEFLTEADPLGTLQWCGRTVIGCDRAHSPVLCRVLRDINQNPSCKTILCSNTEAELIKLMSNSFLATKVTFTNMFFKICEHLNADYEVIRRGFALDKRIGLSHTRVPGSDGQFGYSGSCFPKDIGNLAKWCQYNGIKHDLLRAVQKQNSEYRADHDWRDNKYREKGE
jgi:UDPglucose 6-dehydrogenase